MERHRLQARDHRHRGDQLDDQPHGRDVPAAHAGGHRPHAGAIAKAFTIAREMLDARELWAQIEALDGKVAEVGADRCAAAGDLVRCCARSRAGCSIDPAARSTSPPPWRVTTMASCACARSRRSVLTPSGNGRLTTPASRQWKALGVPSDLAQRLARCRSWARRGHHRGRADERCQPIAEVAKVLLAWAKHWTWHGCATDRRAAGRRPLACGGPRRAARRTRAQHRALASRCWPRAPSIRRESPVQALAGTRRCLAAVHPGMLAELRRAETPTIRPPRSRCSVCRSWRRYRWNSPDRSRGRRSRWFPLPAGRGLA